MRRSVTLFLLAALALASIAVEGEEPEPYEPVFNNERVYTHCGDTNKVSNVEGGTPFGWDTEAPAASVQAGAGCGTLDAVMSSSEETAETLVWEGTHTGNLDELTLELYMIDAGIVRATHMTGGATGTVPQVGAFTEIYADMSLLIDGFEAGFIGEATIPAERTNSDVTVRLRMTLTDIGLLAEDEAGEHTIRLELQTADYYNGDSGAWVWDTTEVPAGVTFSPTEEQRAEYVVTSF